MSYSVKLTAQALESLDAAFGWLAERTQHAPEWYNRVLDGINSLEEMPGRCGLAPENEEEGEEVRQLVVGDHRHGYRIIFLIREGNVMVLDVIHGARESGGAI